MANIKELSEKIPERLGPGHRLCAGCGASIVVRQVLMGTEDPVVAVCSTGCLEVATTIYPYTAWNIPFMHNAFENAASTISGIETAYRALKKKGKVKKEIKFVAFGGDGGCYSDDTEIFTENGFKNIKDIKVRERIWSVNPETNVLELQENEKLHKYPYKGTMIRGKSRFIDFLITPNHNVPMWYKGKWEFIKGIDLLKRYKTSFLRKFNWHVNGLPKPYVEIPKIPKHTFQKEFSKMELKKWLRFLGWYITEGSLYKSKSGYLVRIYQSNSKNKEIIYQLLQSLCISAFKCNRSVDFQSKQIYEYLEKECGKGSKNKKIPKWALSLGKEYLKEIFHSLMEGDGSVTKQKNRSSYHIRFITSSEKLMNNMVELVLKLGKNCKVFQRKTNGVYRIGIDFNYLQHKLYSRRRLYGDRQQVLLENYKGYVYCPQLKKNHTVIIKRNGKISLSGNSYDIGLQAMSGAFERGHNFTYVCYSNEAYMNCLSLSSLIATKEGVKKITEIKESDQVYAFNLKTHQLVLKRCSGVFDNGIKDIYELSTLHHSIKATSNHPFLVAIQDIDDNTGRIVCQTKTNIFIWKTLEQIEIGDEVVSLKEVKKSFGAEEVVSIKYVGKEPTLDLRVEDEHNFIANGIVVHNTGIQRSSATPKGASTTTAPAGKVIPGKMQFRKDLTAIVAAHRIPYVAQGTISHWNDLVTKSQKAFAAKGPAFLNVLSMCHRGWRYPQENTVEIAKLAVETGYWPLIEVEDGIWRFTYKPKERKPIEEFLKTQGRFKHLFTEQNKHIIAEIQKHIDDNWRRLEHLCAASCRAA